MVHTITYSSMARRQIKALDRSMLIRIMPRIGQLAHVPRPQGCVKLAGYDSLWRIRIGDYRVVYEVDDEQERIEVTIVAHRRESYREL